MDVKKFFLFQSNSGEKKLLQPIIYKSIWKMSILYIASLYFMLAF